MKIETRAMETPVGRIALAWTGDVLLAVEMAWAKNRTSWHSKDRGGDVEKRLAARLRERFPDAEVAEGAKDAAPVRALERYFAGDLRAIDTLKVDAGGDGFHARVWHELRRIPAGETRSYGQIAAAAGSDSARAAGGAVGSNPIPIVIPCHRVVGADGKLTGFGGGLPRKRWLLQHEGAAFRDEVAAKSAQATLF
jgi:methylated-DNA-[protein]-cysteine S-methyltransferase